MAFEARSNELLTATIYSAHKSADIDEAIERFAGQLAMYYYLWQVALLWFPGPERVRLMALWARGEEVLEIGMEVDLRLTTDISAAARRVYDGQIEVVDVDSMDLGLLDDLFRQNGLRSIMAVPFQFRTRHAALILSSTRPHAFSDEDTSFVGAVVAGLAGRFGDLISSSGRLD